jgi:hypothetical protein
MEKKPRKRKTLDISIDTKNVDIEIKRDENGKLNVDVDTKKIDVKFEKDADKKTLDIEINDDKTYHFVSNGEAPTMKKGTIWEVTGAMLRIFLKKGLGKIK